MVLQHEAQANALPGLRRYTKHFNGNVELSAANTATAGSKTVASGLHADRNKVFLKRFVVNPHELTLDALNAVQQIGWTSKEKTMSSKTEDQADFIPGSGQTLIKTHATTYDFYGNIDGCDLFFDVDGDAEVEIPIDENGDAKISYYATGSNFTTNKAKWSYKGIVVIEEL